MLRLVFNHHWPPYSMEDEQHRPKGFFFDILEEAISTRMGIPINAVSLPWARAQAEVLNGFADGLITVPTKKRLEYLEASENVYGISLNVYVNGKAAPLNLLSEGANQQSLSPFHACEINGNQSAIERYQRLKVENVTLVTTHQQCLRMLVRGRVDFVALPPGFEIQQILPINMLASLVEIPLKIPADHHMLIRKDSPYAKILPEFNQVIRKMHRDGVIKDIASRYGLVVGTQTNYVQ